MSKMWENTSNRRYKKVNLLADRFIFQSQVITFTSVAAYYPIPPASHQPVTSLGAGFSSEVVASLSPGWICTNWRV